MSARATVRPTTSDQAQTIHDAKWEEEVRRRAYELYLQRSAGEGSEIGDWLQAEAEVNTIAENRVAE